MTDKKLFEHRSTDVTGTELQDEETMEKRRDFIKKYGKLAAITPLALSLAMHSKAQIGSGGGGGGDGGPGF